MENYNQIMWECRKDFVFLQKNNSYVLERHIILDDIDPVVFYGVGNAHLQMIKALYPKLRIVARDSMC